ncbi:type I-F CRISPR-associated helicase Cas3f [Shewanella sp. AS16]|uniref:type I-F CRISPR-associated helicase Cas3f n=1 Tax=Shewanella sp. AS16 TaxID=2907625 RepID=UPI001F267510|nr:type I-F CRISPR-associated helicase Cas3f [Shewanella sp. AS16]MCE9686509.1 type I-F CRISPR-associated helicase Cas3f [Shewanella sp. AS16]
MMVTFVSQCEKNALKKTRRVLDAFANRIGDNTWQTLITEDGLATAKKMLRKTASRSTAVSCHWIRSRSRSQFLWVVGNRNKFNAEGVVPVNRTEKELLVKEHFSLNVEIIAYLAAIAGFFHDIGKANQLFQQKLAANNEGKRYEPLRHEWVSLRLFQAFVGKKNDQQWLTALVEINNSTEEKLVNALSGYRDLITQNIPCPFTSLPPIAAIVGWLVVSHHRLPQYPHKLDNQPDLSSISRWRGIFESCWNSPQSVLESWADQAKEDNWHFPFGTPFKSAFWQTHISNLARRVLNCTRLFKSDWHDNLFTRHMARLSLMLADHAESSRQGIDNTLSDRNYSAFANTDINEEGQRYHKQKLDEHNINVGTLAYQIACDVPRLKYSLKALDDVKALGEKVPEELEPEFGWQDKAAKLAASIKELTQDHGFFGISMASTGKGKTRANAKIMHGLSDPGRCRFNVALGLRTLSIQTANALKDDLFGKDAANRQLAEQNIALLVGSQAVRDLQLLSLEPEISLEEQKGSQSKESLLKDELALLDNLDSELLEKIPWLKHDPKISRLLHAPILVSTIDYLIPATEGVRGGRQIAPMLRLLTSDLVLDEPDDFSLDDLPALCRLVHWAGMLGSRVLLSTATISPSLASSLFEAYQAGRKQYTQANGEQGVVDTVCCAWFDECNKPKSLLTGSVEQFKELHEEYVSKRVNELKKSARPLRKGRLVNLNANYETSPSLAFADRIYQSITELHSLHSIELEQKQVSIGLVRMANIDPLVHIARQLMNRPAPENTRIHYCVYHGQYPLLQRSSIEKMLDKALTRHDKNEWQQNSGILDIINSTLEHQHIFVVLATSVAEVGRDHDYDWAVVEPSSQRSIIQLAGRVQRHRKQVPEHANIHVLAQNYKGLKGKCPSFIKPGFESKKLQYSTTNLLDLNIEKDLSVISAIPRVLYVPSKANRMPDLTEEKKFNKFSELEHFAQMLRLQGSANDYNYAAQWWQHDVSWCGEMQRHQPFRKSKRTDDYCLALTRESQPKWQKKQPGVYPMKYSNTDDIGTPSESLKLGEGIALWHYFNLHEQIEILARKLDKSHKQTLQVYTHVALNELEQDTVQQWLYQPELGIYKILRKDEYLYE